MAVDEAISQSVREGQSPPTLRVYQWTSPSVSIGCFQKIATINLDYCSGRGIAVVRRPTGGRAILHHEELTYSLSAPTTHGPFAGGLHDSYQRISAALSLALRRLGLSPEAKKTRNHGRDAARNPLCFHSVSFAEITLGSRKIIGSAQKRWKDGLLQQGSIPLRIDEEMKAVCNVDASLDLAERMIGLWDLRKDLALDQVKKMIRSSFEETFRVELIPAPLSAEEHLRSRELEAQRYAAPHWTFQR